MDYLTSIQRAIDYIEDHLQEELETETLAKEARFSVWHFQKIFSLYVGDSLKEYVRKRRLTSALIELSSSDKRIIDIAMDYQFESQESFTRSFKALFKRTPGECRKQGLRSILSLNKPRITMEYLDHLYGGLTMQPTIKLFPATKVVGMGGRFISVLSPDKTNMVVIPKLWQEYMQRCKEIKNRKGDADIGLVSCLSAADRRNHPDECFYVAGAMVENFDSVPEGMTTQVIPEGNYAVFTHKGSLDKIGHTMNYIFGSWLPKSGKELREAPDLEIYDDRFISNSDESELGIYIPVK